MHGRRIILILLCCALTSGSLAAQRPVLVRHYSVETMDIGVLSDTVRGVSVVVAPGVLTSQGEGATKVTWLRFAPDSLLQWLNIADAFLRAPVQGNESDGTRWAPPLQVISNDGWLTFGRRIKKHGLARERYARMADSTYSWRFELSPQNVDSLLHLLLEAGAVSRLVKVDSTAGPDALCEKPDRPVIIERQPILKLRGVTGRVAMQFVVDSTGQAEMETFVAIFATNSSVEKAARAAIAKSRFSPAMLDGRPVRQLVQQVAVWY